MAEWKPGRLNWGVNIIPSYFRAVTFYHASELVLYNPSLLQWLSIPMDESLIPHHTLYEGYLCSLRSGNNLQKTQEIYTVHWAPAIRRTRSRKQ